MKLPVFFINHLAIYHRIILRWFIVAGLTLSTSGASGSYPCPSSVDNRPEATKTLQWLERFRGPSKLHGCSIEILACDTSLPRDESYPVGEILVEDALGAEGYVALRFLEDDSPWGFSNVISNKRMLHYELSDHHNEIENGTTELWQLEILTEWNDPFKMDSIELGIYLQNHQLNQPNGNDSRWYVCK